MITDTELKIKGYEILIKGLGKLEAEKFISLIIKDPFDYTAWRKKLFEDKSVYDLSKEAMLLRDKNK